MRWSLIVVAVTWAGCTSSHGMEDAGVSFDAPPDAPMDAGSDEIVPCGFDFPEDGQRCDPAELPEGVVCRMARCDGTCEPTCDCVDGRWSCGIECRTCFTDGGPVIDCGLPPFCCAGCVPFGSDAGPRDGGAPVDPPDASSNDAGGASCSVIVEQCYGGIDDDCDGMVDCADPDCFALPPCVPGCLSDEPPIFCGNGLDDDCDGAADCDDLDCFGRVSSCPRTRPGEWGSGGADCFNGLDDDGDGVVDCADGDCVDEMACRPPCAPNEVGACDDRVDQDCDGAVSCADPDCAGDPACLALPPAELDCGNGEDDDGEAGPDCFDRDCTGAPGCGPGCWGGEVCDNGVNDDCDDRVDCEDEDCVYEPMCLVSCWPGREDCANGLDDDCDGLVDCLDRECLRRHFCASCRLSEQGACANGLDDDCDGRMDCADASCAGDPACP